MKQIIMAALSVTALVLLSITPVHAGGIQINQKTAADQNIQDQEAQQAIADFKNSDPSMKVFF